jgi:hypothetical protein
MEPYIKTAFVMNCIGIFLTLINLCTKRYPYTREKEAWEEVLSLVIVTGFAIWGWVILP